ncbi:MAG: hypothetical protein V4617_13140 [Gemmatimonadota bacterium]
MSAEYNPNKLGWPAAAVTVVGTLGLLFAAYSIHDRTYRHPRDPMMQQVYHERDAAGGGHGAAAAAEEHAGKVAPAGESAPAGTAPAAGAKPAGGH